MAVTKDRYQLEIETRQAQASLVRLSTIMKGFAAVIAVDQIVDFGKAMINASKQMQSLENQLRLVTTSSADLTRLMGLLREEAVKNRTAFASTVELFTKLRVATEELGVSEERVIKVVGKLSQALQVAGADAATTNSVIRQFSQAMASGTVRGDEFNSLVEGLGPALAIMARESGITVGELRRLSQAGELTAEKMLELLENSNSLTEAFNKMKPTLDTLETQLSDAFDAALIKVGEVTGATQGYENALQRLTRLLSDFADLQGSLTEMSPGDIFKEAREGAIGLDAAIYELSERLRNDNWTLGLSLSDEEEAAIKGILDQLTILKVERDIAAKVAQQAAEKEADALKTQREALASVLAPHKKFIDQAKEFAKTDYRTELEKANQRIIDAEIVIEQLNLAFERSNGQIDNFVMLLRGAENELQAATEEVKKLQEQAAKDIKLEGFEKFYADLLEDSKDIVDTTNYVREAQMKLFQDMKAGTITVEQFREAMEILRETQNALSGDTDMLADNVNDFIRNMVDGTDDLRAELETLNMDPLEKQLHDIENNLTRDMQRQITELKEQLGEFDADTINQQVERVRTATQAQIQQQKELARQIYEQQRSFEYGWSKAYKSYEDDATNAAKKAEDMFKKTSKGIEDSIVSFVKTGKFEFKSLISDILEQLLRSQIQQIIAQTFQMPFGGGGGTVGGGLGDLFAGFFANGGQIPAGKFGVVGERGPELVTGPATVTPMGAGGAVTYNINAVDAASFKQMIARDPGFIHAVASQGARKVPMGR